MRNRNKAAAFLLSGALIVLLAWGLSYTREPHFRGKPLSYWTLANARYIREQHEDPKYAIAQIGTNALPHLLRWMDQKPYDWQTAFHAYTVKHLWLARLAPSGLTGIGAKNRAFAALQAIPCLGPAARPAIPRLLQTTTNTNHLDPSAVLAVEALVSIGPEAFPALLTVATNRQVDVGNVRTVALGRIGKLGNASAVLPLVDSLRDPDPSVVLEAATALGDLKLEPALVVPALVAVLLQPPRSAPGPGVGYITHRAAWALAEFGTNASPAVPALLLTLAKQDDDDVRSHFISCQLMSTLASTTIRPEPAVAVLTNYLRNTNTLLRRCAASALSQMGPRAHEALPSLTNALQLEHTREMAETAIRRIILETPTNAPPQ